MEIKMNHDMVGKVVWYDGMRWFVDNDDEDFKDEQDYVSLFIIPEQFKDPDEYDKVSDRIDYIGYWVPASDVKEI